MDRRQRKTREAIFKAFIYLLSEKNFSRITVEEIINIADVGRATFYAHFETKDYLLKELCAELFDHIFSSEKENANLQSNLFQCDTHDSVFLHLFKHIQQNDNNIAKLLSSKNNELFLEYFKNGVKTLVEKHIYDFKNQKPAILPKDFWTNHITSTFIETLKWWLENKMEQSPETITDYFLQTI